MKQYKLNVSAGTVLATVFGIKKEGNYGTNSLRSATFRSFDCFRNLRCEVNAGGGCSVHAAVV